LNREDSNTPLISAIQQHFKREPVSFHVPGHKNGKLFHSSLMEDFKDIHKYDVTELEGLDDLHHPTGAILKAQELCAAFYQAQESVFLVGGSTAGNLAMVHGLTEAGGQILIQRNSHKSLFHAIELFQVEPIFLKPELEKETGHPLGPSLTTIEEAIDCFPEAKVLFLTYPNYYGAAFEIKILIDKAHEAGLIVCVDEAHGAHFALGGPFPPSALQLGADIVVQSAHKMLPALTMGSYLHFHPSLAKEIVELVKHSLSMLQSSSPSYLIMAALDGARAYIEQLNEENRNEVLAGVQSFIDEIATIPQLEVIKRSCSSYSQDPLKVTIKSCTKLSGYELQELLYKEGIDVELADDKHVLFVFGLGDYTDSSYLALKLKRLLSEYNVINEEVNIVSSTDKITQLSIPSHQVKKYSYKVCSIDKAVGHIAAEEIVPYPPGIPLVFKGEVLKQSVMKDIVRLHESGAVFQGNNPLIDGLKVVDLEEIK
jgi:lysine decarboxylase